MPNESPPQHQVTGLRWVDDGGAVEIRWGDGHVSNYTRQYLRRICPCASCRGTHEAPPLSAKPKARFSVLTDQQIRVLRDEVTVERAYPIGNYALGFQWSDGHNEGIYTFAYLREMCPSEQNAQRLEGHEAADSAGSSSSS